MLLHIRGKVKAVGKHLEQGLCPKVLEGLHRADQLNMEILVKAFYTKPQQIIQRHTAHNTDEHRAAHLFVGHDDNGQKGTQRHYHGHNIAPAPVK